VGNGRKESEELHWGVRETIFVSSCGRKPLQNLCDFGSIAWVIEREKFIVSQPIRLEERSGGSKFRRVSR
jgi:hypothetical protein